MSVPLVNAIAPVMNIILKQAVVCSLVFGTMIMHRGSWFEAKPCLRPYTTDCCEAGINVEEECPLFEDYKLNNECKDMVECETDWR